MREPIIARECGICWLIHVVAASESEDISPRASGSARALALMSITAVTLVAYSNSFPGIFVFDDAASIVENPSIRGVWPPGPVLSPPAEAGVGGRPIANLTFALNYAIGGLNASGFRAVNLGLHLATALILFAVVRRTLEQPRLRALFGRAALPVAALVSMLWSTHPLTTAVVNYSSQRTELLMALCYLLTVYGLIRAAESRQRRWPILGVAACAAGMASKEVMVTAPIVALLYDRIFIAGSWREALRIRAALYTGLAATWLLLAWLIVSSHIAERGVGFHLGLRWTDYFFTQARAVLHYLRLVVWPIPLVFDYGWSFVRGAAAALPWLAALFALIGFAFVALRRLPAVGFAACAIFLILAPTSSIVPIVQQPIAESRMYLPLAAAIALIAATVFVAVRRFGLLVLACSIVGFASVTLLRNADYRSEVTLWSDTIAKQPGNARAHANLSAALLRANRGREALTAAETATRLMPAYAQGQHNLALALAQSGRRAEAIEHYELALKADPGAADTHYNLAEMLLAAGRREEAVMHLESALRLRPEHARAHNNLAVVLLELGRAADAAQHARAALQIEPDFAEAHYNLGNALARMDDPAGAISSYQSALQFQPALASAHNNLGVLHLQAGDLLAAVREFERALQIDPAHASARRNLERARRKIP